MRDVEEAAVRDALFWGPRPPRVEMRVKVDDRDWAVDFV